MPKDIESYTHRIGRTGRAGKKGNAATFVTGEVSRRRAWPLDPDPNPNPHPNPGPRPQPQGRFPNQGGFPPAAALRVFTQLVAAVDHCHGHGAVRGLGLRLRLRLRLR